MPQEYLFLLYKEFCHATGMHIGSKINFKVDADFINWLINYRKLLGHYEEHLLESINRDHSKYYECDKGQIDSITTSEFRISPYETPSSKLLISDNNGFIISNRSIRLIKPTEQFMTFNPQSIFRFNDFAILHNKGNNIILSVLGNLSDADRVEKLKLLKMSSQLFTREYEEYYDTYNDEYFYTIYSDEKKLTKEKIYTKTIKR